MSRIRFASLVGIQLLALGAMALWCASILYLPGETIVLQTWPVDPRSLFTGDYVHLNYEATNLSEHNGVRFASHDFVEGEEVFVLLEKRPDTDDVAAETHHPVAVARTPFDPDEGPCLKARVDWAWGDDLRVEYPVDRYYVDERVAKKWEEAARMGRMNVFVKVDAFGRGAITGVELVPDEDADAWEDFDREDLDRW